MSCETAKGAAIAANENCNELQQDAAGGDESVRTSARAVVAYASNPQSDRFGARSACLARARQRLITDSTVEPLLTMEVFGDGGRSEESRFPALFFVYSRALAALSDLVL
jgi:hypothetical protein